MRILVIEDDRKIALLLAKGFGEAGHDVTLHVTGRAGLMAALTGGFDLVLLDNMLPDADGPSIARGIRAGGLATPIVMVSALDSAADVAAGLASGADAYLTKPFRLDDLFARVDAFGTAR